MMLSTSPARPPTAASIRSISGTAKMKIDENNSAIVAMKISVPHNLCVSTASMRSLVVG